jgi:hypothetical protein
MSDSTSRRCTDGANDAGTAVDLLGLVVSVQRGLPFQLGAIVEMSESVRHLDDWTWRDKLLMQRL